MLRLLTVAASDSGGGAGIQADLKVFAALGAHGMSAVTAVTAQHTQAVEAVHQVPADVVRAQIRAVAGDIGVDAVKTGVLVDSAVIGVVAGELSELCCLLVVDPVMVASTGARLLAADAVGALREQLLPLATLATPNLDEARVLARDTSLSPPEAAEAVYRLGPDAVVVTGGDADGVDWFCDVNGVQPIEGPLHRGGATHGSGCTHSAALAVYLARGCSPLEAARTARALTARAVAHGLRDLGRGPGPVNVAAMEVGR